MKLKVRYLFIITLLLFSLTFVSSEKVIQTNVGDVGLQIFFPSYEYIKVNTPFELHIHAANLSDGKEITNDLANCSLHLYSKNGTHLLETNLSKDENGRDWMVLIGAGNFSQYGEHAFRIYCLDSVGGTAGGIYTVTQSGEYPDATRLVAYIIFLISIMAIIILISGKHKNTDFTLVRKRITDNHKNMGETTVKGILLALFQNSFIWLYFSGWLLILVLRQILYEFGSGVVYEYFEIITTIYSLGLLLLTVYMIGYAISYMRNIFSILTDNDWGVGE